MSNGLGLGMGGIGDAWGHSWMHRMSVVSGGHCLK